MSDQTAYIVMTDCDGRPCPDNPEHECGEALFVTTDHAEAQEIQVQLAELDHGTTLITAPLVPKGWRPVKQFEIDVMIRFHPNLSGHQTTTQYHTWYAMGSYGPGDVRVSKYSHAIAVRSSGDDDGKGNTAVRFEVEALTRRIESRIKSHLAECKALPNFEAINPAWFYDLGDPKTFAD